MKCVQYEDCNLLRTASWDHLNKIVNILGHTLPEQHLMPVDTYYEENQ